MYAISTTQSREHFLPREHSWPRLLPGISHPRLLHLHNGLGCTESWMWANSLAPSPLPFNMDPTFPPGHQVQGLEGKAKALSSVACGHGGAWEAAALGIRSGCTLGTGGARLKPPELCMWPRPVCELRHPAHSLGASVSSSGKWAHYHTPHSP